MSMEISTDAGSIGSNAPQNRPPARIFGSPQRYVQAEGAIDQLGEYLLPMGVKRAAVLLSARSQKAEGGRLLKSLETESIRYQVATFQGECSLNEIEKHVDDISQSGESIDVFIAIGGGKVVDAGKSIAFRLKVPVVIVPSLASNDAPCSALSVIYTPEGVVADVEFFPENPALVLVDTGVVAVAEPRHLIAGIGDAMATWYEARVCAENTEATNALGGRPTLAGTAIAQLCAETIYEYGPQAVLDVQQSKVTDALERVVEANILLSGVGFESGGLAVAHAVASGYTVIERVHKNFLHGEMVAMGVLTQLALEENASEAEKATRFFVSVGLPVHLGQISMTADTSGDEELSAVVESSLGSPIVANMPFTVTASLLRAAMIKAHQLGKQIVEEMGDKAYLELHAN